MGPLPVSPEYGASPPPPRFFADAMLGRLATWLRIVGCDVSYRARIDDAELVERALEDARVILTRDTLLVRRRKARGNHFFVTGDDYRAQFRQVVAHFGIDPLARLLTRCVRCNEPLLAIGKKDVAGRVPPYVLATQDAFSHCPGCGRVYWGATHREAMIRAIRAMLR
jgi:uncharacterized protein with PIN domain